MGIAAGAGGAEGGAGLGTGLFREVLTYKALRTEFRIARLAKDPACALCGTAPQLLAFCVRVNRRLNHLRQHRGMGREIHYEVFRRVGAKGGWTMHEIVASRDVAINLWLRP